MGLDLDYIHTLAEKIELPSETREPLYAYLDRHIMAVESMADQVRKSKGWINCLKAEMRRKQKQDDRYLFALAVTMALSQDTLHRYEKNGLPAEVFYHTMTDFTIWSNVCLKRYQKPGMEAEGLGWIQNHLVPNLYRIGRLQFQFSNFYLPVYLTRKQRKAAPARRKEPCIFVHIPAGEPLDEAACTASFEEAGRFFETYFPDYCYRYYITDSWLLDPQNHNILPAESNILKFAARFQVLGAKRDDDALHRIFIEAKSNPDDYPEETRLQANVKAYLKNHGKMGVAFGVLKK